MASGLCYAAGYLVGLLTFAWMASWRGLATSGVFSVMAVGLIGGLVGANLANWLATGAAGKTVLGGLAGGYLAVVLYKRKIGLRRPLGDLFAVALCAGEAVGRWGCYFGGCCYGRLSTLPWAVWQHGALRHPTQIYLSLASLSIFILLLRVDRIGLPENGLFYLQGFLYCLARFAIEFWRASPVSAGGLTTAQWACLAGATFFAIKGVALLRPREVRHEAVS